MAIVSLAAQSSMILPSSNRPITIPMQGHLPAPMGAVEGPP